MKLSLATIAVTLLFPAMLFSQIRWQTTHVGTSSGECQLEINKLWLTIQPFYIDVEEEVVIGTRGTVWSGDSSTLEIFGEFTLSKGSALRSMLLWNGSTILKAKLKDRNAADSAYENVVDRDKPRPVVRDPVVVEYVGNDRYRIKIYPVRINNARKIRILYTVPFQSTGNGPRFQVSPAFLSAFSQRPTQIPVTFRKSPLLKGNILLGYGAVTKTIQFGSTYQIPMSDWNIVQNTLFITPDTTITMCAYAASIDSGRASGHYTALYAALPDTVKAGIKEVASKGSYTVEAAVKAGEFTYITDFNQKAYLTAYIKSGEAWDSTVYWTIYNKEGKAAMRIEQRTAPLCDSLTQSMLPLVWGAKYTLTEGNDHLGAIFGFVDRKMSLLALESDSLPASEAADWLEEGVPPLSAKDIVLKPSQYPSAPSENAIFELATGIRTSKADALSIAAIVMMPNRMFRITLSKPMSGNVRVVLYDISGKVLATWNNVRPVGNAAELALPRAAKGFMIVRVYADREVLQKKFVFTR